MAGEVKVRGPSTGKSCYCRILGSGVAVWSASGGTGAFEAFSSGNWSSYAIALTEQGISNIYVGDFPLAVPPGYYDVEARQQLGGSAAQTDPPVGQGGVDWNGSKTVPLSDLATSGQLGQLQPMRAARGCMIQHFLFDLVSSLDHVTSYTSGTISGQIVRDNGATFGALQSGAFVEVGLGVYRLQAFTSGDLLANTAFAIFTASKSGGVDSDPRRFSFLLQRTSGQP